ncbi:DUF2140 family protein [Jeotgalibaca caeni]|uniref:DUF2140 family protein n=1 Tax=Jeotgalibaca caeni TaxID=3028623 RepID=UPI00237D654B|nr:DUF2140 family protein [Jeotgalibaca caeni]MDE1548458.1 DUF2140 family protein [Jeotgalibaca caeni]
MEKRTRSNRPGWKVAFFILLILNIVVVVAAISAITTDPQNMPVEQATETSTTNEDSLVAQVTLNEKDLEGFLQQFLEAQEGEVTPQIEIAGNVYLSGEWQIFGLPVSYLIQAEPFSQENGDLQLKVKDIQLGAFSLPVAQSLRLFANLLAEDVPVSIDAENELMTVLLTSIQTDQLQGIHLIQIDKENQEYEFEITIDKQNLLQ